jgi:predicted ChrR family anti-sigma factor
LGQVNRSIFPDRDRLLRALLAAHAASGLSEPFAVAVASYLQMQADRRHVAEPTTQQGEGDLALSRLPLALRSYAARHLVGAIQWRTILPGLKLCPIAQDGGAAASLLRCRAGRAIPAHTHEGIEAVLVLQGRFQDAGAEYARGDLAVADDSVDHRPVVTSALDCIAYLVLGGPVRLTGPLGRLVPGSFGA